MRRSVTRVLYGDFSTSANRNEAAYHTMPRALIDEVFPPDIAARISKEITTHGSTNSYWDIAIGTEVRVNFNFAISPRNITVSSDRTSVSASYIIEDDYTKLRGIDDLLIFKDQLVNTGSIVYNIVDEKHLSSVTTLPPPINHSYNDVVILPAYREPYRSIGDVYHYSSTQSLRGGEFYTDGQDIYTVWANGALLKLT